MRRPQFNVITERCDNLRWKGLYIDPESDPSAAEHLWCAKSQHSLGPDGKLVDKWECNPARSCYKPL